MSNQAMQFLYGDRELLLRVDDLLCADVDVIVNDTDSALSHQQGLALRVSEQAGPVVEQESRLLINQYRQIDPGMAVYTGAGQLPFQALIHTVAPMAGQVDTQACLQQSISRSLLLCETNAWSSIAYPALGVAAADIPVEVSAQAFFRAITSFWDARIDCAVSKVVICLEQAQFETFFNAFRDDAISTDSETTTTTDAFEDQSENIGYVDLDQADLEQLDDDEINSWFK